MTEQKAPTIDDLYTKECAIIGEAYSNIRHERKRIKVASARRAELIQQNAALQAKVKESEANDGKK